MNTKSVDVLIVGAGIAGSVLAHNLKKTSDLNVLILEKRKIGFHEPSYYASIDFLKKYALEDLILNYIDKFRYDTDNGLETFGKTGSENYGIVPYIKLCEQLIEDIPIVYDTFISIEKNKVTLKSGNIIIATNIVDTTGWESPIRKDLGLNRPKIGPHTIMVNLENCNFSDTNEMIFSTGNIASLGFWVEPTSKTTANAGSGYWDYLDNDINQNFLEEAIEQYLNQYPSIFSNAKITYTKFAKIGADPVAKVVNGNIISLGESAGQSDPFWVLGSSLIVKHAEVLSNIIIQTFQGNSSLTHYQQYWENELEKTYASRWARARVIWNFYTSGWYKLLKSRSKLKKYITPEKVKNRMNGKSKYPLLYQIKTLGVLNIFKIFYYQRIFWKRIHNNQLYNSFEFYFRNKGKCTVN